MNTRMRRALTLTALSSRRINIITSIMLFITVFTLWQIYDSIMLYISPPIIIIYLLYLTIPSISLAAFVFVTKLTKSTLRKQGYRKPTTIAFSKCLLISAIFIIIYLFIYLFPAFLTGNFYFQGLPTNPLIIVNRAAAAVLLTLAGESIFRGYVFRNLVGNHGFFASLYASSILFALSEVSINNVIHKSLDQIAIYVFTTTLPSFAAGLFLGFFFYKIGWSLLGPAIFGTGIRFFLYPLPIVVPASSPPWWMALTFEMMSYAVMIFVTDSMIKEPHLMRRRYGLEDSARRH